MIGGYAYNLYRNPRATGDIDFFVSIDSENEARMRQALNDFGFGSSVPPQSQPLLVDGKVIMLGRSPIRIDILTKIDGVTFTEVEATSQRFKLGDLSVPVISPQMLLKNKLSTGRAEDNADAVELTRWLSELNGRSEA